MIADTPDSTSFAYRSLPILIHIKTKNYISVIR